ncbi:MAG: aldo/keto reductase [Deltaproteobacteria bacterium]|nr:MAG: aldo/keto reductase [Deltaproteobacteria bacterium]
MKHVTTATGAAIPALGYGTWRLSGPEAYRGVREALDVGYRHIDTAQLYGNETECGQAIAQSDVPRDQVFLTTKVWRDHLDRDGILRTTDESLARIGSDYVDLLLLHWPNARFPMEAALDALVEVQQAGKARYIGVSNYPSAMLAAAAARAPITTNQVEYHCLLGQQAVLEVAAEHGIAVTAYCPLAQGRLADQSVLAEIGEAHGATPAQIALAWLVGQEGVAAIPKSRNAERIAENFAALDIALSADERARIDALPKNQRTVDPAAFAIPWDPS